MPHQYPRRSITRPVGLRGVGLHTGAECGVEFVAAPANTGIRFVRTDLPGHPEIPASLEFVTSTDRRTELAVEGASRATVSTVEHVLAAVVGMGITDLIVRLEGPEPPQVDGSALPFCRALLDAGPVDYPDPTGAFVIETSREVEDGGASYRMTPAARTCLTVTIDFAHPAIGTQTCSFTPSAERFAEDFAGARTFGFASELTALRERQLIRGARNGAGILFSDTGMIGGPLRWPDECVRHKTLDLLGDLALLGAPVIGHIVARRPSHRGNVTLARAVASSCRLETARAGHS